ncbi:MAG TPA: hypothetical protein VLL48_11820, partial [Longimicrobiales bacterium]|nr:hypothetical protein [Longimicrobiales bacterium]
MSETEAGARLDRRPRAPEAVRWIVRTLEEAGHPTWAVGGAVRDTLLGREGGDWDLATRARPREIRGLFPRTVPIGIEHGTVGVLDRSGTLFEVTTFRRDVETLGRHAVVEFADSIDEDLARRDFTINALAWHPLREELHDPFGGLDDLDRRVLRTVGRPGERFAEDYLRVLRALRFAGQFSLTVEEETWLALCRAVEGLDQLSAERVREELMKVLGDEEPPSRALGLYAASGALARFAPELDATVDAVGPDGRVGEHWIRALLSADVLPAARPLLRLAALLRWTGRTDEAAGDHDGSPGPDESAGRRTAALMTRLRFSNAETDRVTALVRAGPEPPDPGEGGPALRRWLARNGPERLPDHGRLWIAEARVERLRGRPGAAEGAVASWRALRAELAAN